MTSAEYEPLQAAGLRQRRREGMLAGAGAGQQIEVHRQPGEGQFAERALHGPGGRLTRFLRHPELYRGFEQFLGACLKLPLPKWLGLRRVCSVGAWRKEPQRREERREKSEGRGGASQSPFSEQEVRG